jgi:hypothetical protein
MGIGTIFRVLLQILAGVGVAELADKILPSKVSGYEPVSPGLRVGRKLAFFVGTMGVGALAWNFINRKFHILTPRHARRSRKRRRSKR